MVQFVVERTIDLPVEKAWEILSDFSNVHNIHPLVGSVTQVSPEGRGLDAVRTCHLYNGQSATEKIVKWDEEKRTYVIDLVEAKLPVNRLVAAFFAEDAGEGQTKLLSEMDVVAKYGVIGRIMEKLVIKPQFAKAIGNLFAGIEEFAKTGKQIQKGYNATTPPVIRDM